MRLIINNEPVIIDSDSITLDNLLKERNIPITGCAVTVNNALITRTRWGAYNLKENDNLVIISAAFGG